jgi:hypothetical protein
MNISWDGLAHIQNLVRLDFIFSGLEVSSSWVLAARFAFLLLFGGGLIWVAYRIAWKVLDCVQTLLAGAVHLPKSFFLVLLLVIPLSSESLGARSLGYILVVFFVLALVAALGLILVLWKYGVDQTLRLLDTLRSRSETAGDQRASASPAPENVVIQPPVGPSLRDRMAWPSSG